MINSNLENTDFTLIKKKHSDRYIDKVTGDAIVLYGSERRGWVFHILGDYDNNTTLHYQESVLGYSVHLRFRFIPEMPVLYHNRNRGGFLVEGICIRYKGNSKNGYLDIVKLDIDSIEYRFITQVLDIDKS